MRTLFYLLAVSCILLLMPTRSRAQTKVLIGIEVLKQENFAPLKGCTIGIITNQTGLDEEGNRTIDLIAKAPGVKVTKLFSPEHGLYGVKDEKVGDTVDEKSGLKVLSLYGKTRRPTREMLQGIDTLVFDIQDVGARFYTYSATLGICMEEAAKNHLKFVVLDRPNPIGTIVEGPLADQKHLGFTAFRPIPVAHGMTFGELARMYNEYTWPLQGAQTPMPPIHCDLQVIQMKGWQHSMWWEQTGLKWINPSPNMRSPTEALLYPGVCLLEATNVSVGRGTDIPFELVGAPYIDGNQFAKAMNDLKLPGVSFSQHDFTPKNTVHKFNDKPLHGIKITITDRDKVHPVDVGVALAWTLLKLYPNDFEYGKVVNLLQNQTAADAIKALDDPRKAPKIWAKELNGFKKAREKYLMYQ